MKYDNLWNALAGSRGPSRRQPPRRGNRVDVLVGRRLREARLTAGASRAQLAAVLGVSVPSVQRYESGARRLTAARLAAAVKFLGVPMSHLFKEEVSPAARMEAAGLTPLEIDLVMSFRAIASGARREEILRLARTASEEPCPTE